jgi:hypothetical protein
VSPYCNVPDGQLAGLLLLPGLVVARCHPLLIGFLLGLLMLAVEKPAQ